MKKLVGLLLAALLVSGTLTAYAVPDRLTGYLLDYMTQEENAALGLTASEESPQDILFHRSMYDQLEYGAIDTPADWWDADTCAGPLTDASGAPVLTDAGDPVFTYTGDPVMEYVNDPARQFRGSTSVRQALTNLLGASLDQITVTEVLSVRMGDISKQGADDVPVTFHFVNQYRSDFSFVALIGAADDSRGEATPENVKKLFHWKVSAAEVVPDAAPAGENGVECGDLRLVFTPEMQEMVSGRDMIVVFMGAGNSHMEPYEVTITEYVDVPVEVGPPSMSITEMVTVEVVRTEARARRVSDVRRSGDENADGTPQAVPLCAQSLQVYEDAYRYVSEQRGPAIDFFGPGIREEAAAALPGADLDKLEIYEVTDVYTDGYLYGHGDLVAAITFPEQFDALQPMAAVAGSYREDGTPVWTLLKAEAANGNAQVTFTQNIMTRMENKDNNILFILYQPAEESQPAL